MTQYIPYVFGAISFFVGLYLFLLSFKIYQPKNKTDDQKERMEKWYQKFGTLMKVVSIILIINGLYDLIARNPDRYKISEKEKTEWTESDRQSLIKGCLKDAQESATLYPEFTKEFCECTIDKIMTNMTYEEYIESHKLPKEEQVANTKSLIQDCLDELQRKIEENE
jgi:hypothetical protein